MSEQSVHETKQRALAYIPVVIEFIDEYRLKILGPEVEQCRPIEDCRTYISPLIKNLRTIEWTAEADSLEEHFEGICKREIDIDWAATGEEARIAGLDDVAREAMFMCCGWSRDSLEREQIEKTLVFLKQLGFVRKLLEYAIAPPSKSGIQTPLDAGNAGAKGETEPKETAVQLNSQDNENRNDEEQTQERKPPHVVHDRFAIGVGRKECPLGSGNTFEFAAVLIENFGKFVDKDSIDDAVWKSADVRPLSRNSLPQLANKLRKALGQKRICDPVVASQKGGSYGLFWKAEVPAGSKIQRVRKAGKITKKSARNDRRISRK
jgi:hypothetical protein